MQLMSLAAWSRQPRAQVGSWLTRSVKAALEEAADELVVVMVEVEVVVDATVVLDWATAVPVSTMAEVIALVSCILMTGLV